MSTVEEKVWSPSDQVKIDAGICVVVNGEVLYVPTDKALPFHEADAPYVLTHGGRGSGKSHMLRWDAHMRNLALANHKALLLRRTFPQLRNSHFGPVEIEAKKMGASPLHKTEYRIKYPNGSILQFGHCESDAAILDYLSQEWDWIGFDELTTFTYDQFIRISASARTTKASGRKAYVRAATNPIGEGAGWVKRFFIDKNVEPEENKNYVPSDWVDIPANMDDNPHLDQENYERRLEMLGSDALRRAYRHGEWLVEGQFFSEWRERTEFMDPETSEYRVIPWHVIPELPAVWDATNKIRTPLLKAKWVEITRAIDWGYAEMQPGWVGWFAHLPDGTVICFKEWVFMKKTPAQVAAGILERSQGMKVRYTVGDPIMGWEREGESIAETMAKNGVSVLEADNDRPNGWVRVHSWLQTTRNDGLSERPMLQFLQRDGDLGCPYAIRTLPSLQVDPKKPHDCTQGEGVEDHAADAIRYWAMSRPSPSRMPKKTLRHLPKEIREAIYGANSDGEVLGSESVRR